MKKNYLIISLFILSMIFSFAFKPLNVKADPVTEPTSEETTTNPTDENEGIEEKEEEEPEVLKTDGEEEGEPEVLKTDGEEEGESEEPKKAPATNLSQIKDYVNPIVDPTSVDSGEIKYKKDYTTGSSEHAMYTVDTITNLTFKSQSGNTEIICDFDGSEWVIKSIGGKTVSP